MTFHLSANRIKADLKTIAATDTHVKTALKSVGYPGERRSPPGFDTLLRVIVGQQLSVKAAATIWGRVAALAGDDATPPTYAALEDASLRAAGLSRQKVSYFRSLCDTVLAGDLQIDQLHTMSDEDVTKAITAVKGLGVWSAHMYLMFSLGRPDVWPVGDLAVRVGIGRIIGLEDRPTEKQLQTIGERWQDRRSSMALLAWHYYANAPL